MEKNTKLNVWVMTNEYSPNIIGGLGTVATQLTKALAKENLSITLLCTSPFYSIENAGKIRVFKLPAIKEYYDRQQRSFKTKVVAEIIEQNGVKSPDVIHVHSLQFTELALYFKHKYACPIVYTCHSLVDKRTKKPSRFQQEKLIKNAGVIVVPSRWQMELLQRAYSSERHKIKVIQHGVSKGNTNKVGSDNRLLFVGRLIRAKGIEELLGAIKLLKTRRKNVELHVIGTGSSSYHRHLRKLCRKKGIDSHIQWYGFVSPEKVLKMYAEFGALIMPSKEESFGLVALEAMANGVPLVSTRSGGLTEFVNKQNAQIISKVTPYSIAKAINQMWRNPEQTKRRVKQAHVVADNLNWAERAKIYKQAFEQVVSDHKQSQKPHHKTQSRRKTFF